MVESDVGGAVALQRACFPHPFPKDLLWQEGHLLHHLEIFPAGQFVATYEGSVVGSATNLIISEANFHRHSDWETTVGGHLLNAHDPGGTTLFGVDISVDPSNRGQGVARGLYGLRFQLTRDLSLVRYATACRMPDFRDSGEMSVHTYAQQVAAGLLTDRTMTPLLKMGLSFERVIENHMDDEESGNAAAVLTWEQ